MPRRNEDDASIPFTVRFPPNVEATLVAVARQLGLDKSNTVRFLIMSKGRELGIDATDVLEGRPTAERPRRTKRKQP
jgi:hypothetical protein